MTTTIHTSESRGYANHGWLITHHSFSFANYYNPQRMQFGALRVLNDDFIEAGKGFSMHPHENMEIITIPIRGTLVHQDSMGNKASISPGEIQVMSAGTGIYHSEFAGKLSDVELFQIWIHPNKKYVTPRYQQVFLDSCKQNALNVIIAPEDYSAPLWIHQNAWLSYGVLDAKSKVSYKINSTDNGIFIFIINGSASIDHNMLRKRDAITFTNTEVVEIISNENDTTILCIEVPLK